MKKIKIKKKRTTKKIEKVNGALVLKIDVVLIPPVQFEKKNFFHPEKKRKKVLRFAQLP